jgi:hypothetical protein
MKFSIRVEGLAELRESLKGISKALKELDSHITSLRFNPNDEDSIKEAIRLTDEEIDRRLAPFAKNPAVQNIAAEVKAKFARGIRQRAEEARKK